MEYQQQQLQRHCRVCGNRLNKTKGKPQTVYSCKQHIGDLSAYAGVEIGTTEDEHVFPQQFCNACHSGQNGQPKMKFLFTCMEMVNTPGGQLQGIIIIIITIIRKYE